ncbi:MAG: aminotransferase class V-fold PLP-dependent enzyme [Alphaproteobacteria bacterium]|nr:aminotransferase class V-fold PLP-dependent enzyme [Alphaproteobacteria bacterium]
MTIDVAAVRAETPGVRNVLHLNNAGAALQPQPVLDAVMDHLRLEADQGGYEAARLADAALENFYTAAARLVGGKPREIAFIENATRAWDMAFYAFDWQPGDRILTAAAEYASNYIAYLQVARKYEVEITAVPSTPDGELDTGAMADAVDDRVKLIAITHVPTNGGLVNPAAAVGEIAKRHDIPFLLDACQSVGQMPVDVNAIGCDMLSATGRKYLRGPRATGFLWVRESLIDRLEPPFLDLHAAEWTAPDRFEIRDDARRFENWECNFAGKVGLGVAIDYASEIGLEAIWTRVQLLADGLRNRLSALPGVTVRDIGAVQGGIVSFTADGHDPQDLVDALRARAINVSNSGRTSTLLDMDARGLEAVVRASVHYYNTEEELDRFQDALAEILGG